MEGCVSVIRTGDGVTSLKPPSIPGLNFANPGTVMNVTKQKGQLLMIGVKKQILIFIISLSSCHPSQKDETSEAKVSTPLTAMNPLAVV